MLGLPEAKWENREKEQEQEALDDLDVKQSKLSGYRRKTLKSKALK
jgi:hypothetical protein